MNANWCICGLVSALALVASPDAVAQKPLQMDLQPLLQANAPAARPSPGQRAAHRNSFVAPRPQVIERDRRLTDRHESRQDVLSTLGVGLLTGGEELDTTLPAEPNNGQTQLRFKKPVHLARDIKRGYRNMGEKLARKAFDDPRGKRIVFDVDGRVGVGIEITLDK